MHEKPKVISAIGAIPKNDGGIRIIHDCSRPEGKAVNDYANNLDKFKYESVVEASKLLHPNWFMAKIDLKSVYRSVPIHPDDHQS